MQDRIVDVELFGGPFHRCIYGVSNPCNWMTVRIPIKQNEIKIASEKEGSVLKDCEYAEYEIVSKYGCVVGLFKDKKHW